MWPCVENTAVQRCGIKLTSQHAFAPASSAAASRGMAPTAAASPAAAAPACAAAAAEGCSSSCSTPLQPNAMPASTDATGGFSSRRASSAAARNVVANHPKTADSRCSTPSGADGSPLPFASSAARMRPPAMSSVESNASDVCDGAASSTSWREVTRCQRLPLAGCAAGSTAAFRIFLYLLASQAAVQVFVACYGACVVANTRRPNPRRTAVLNQKQQYQDLLIPAGQSISWLAALSLGACYRFGMPARSVASRSNALDAVKQYQSNQRTQWSRTTAGRNHTT